MFDYCVILSLFREISQKNAFLDEFDAISQIVQKTNDCYAPIIIHFWNFNVLIDKMTLYLDPVLMVFAGDAIAQDIWCVS